MFELDRLNRAMGKAKYNQRHVITLRCTGGEGVGGAHDARRDFLRGQAERLSRRIDQALFAPFFKCGVHGFTDSVGVQYDHVTGHEGYLGLFVLAFH